MNIHVKSEIPEVECLVAVVTVAIFAVDDGHSPTLNITITFCMTKANPRVYHHNYISLQHQNCDHNYK